VRTRRRSSSTQGARPVAEHVEITARYDDTCRVCVGSVEMFERLDTSGSVHFEPLEDGAQGDEMIVEINGETLGGWVGVAALARVSGSRRLAPLVWMDRYGPSRRVAESVYGFVARYRHLLARKTAR